jgi:hypothetical protein
VAIISGVKNGVGKLRGVPSFGNTEVKIRCCKLRTSAATNCASSLLESQLYCDCRITHWHIIHISDATFAQMLIFTISNTKYYVHA